jgi:hypothetical protein
VSEPWQVLADCPHCRIEAAVLEWMDPAHPPCARGVALWRRCRACGAAERSDATGQLRETSAPTDLRDPGRAQAAIARWAAEEGEGDPSAFCAAHLGGDLTEVVGRLARGEPVGSTFDVIAFLFPGAGAAGAGPEPRPRVVDGAERAAPAASPPEVRMDARTPGRFLVSVMVADGALRAGERTFVDAFLARHHLPPLDPTDLRVWRPLELGAPPPPAQRDQLLEAAVHLMHLDRARDGSEWRVVKVFASAWGVPESQLRAWDERYGRRYTSLLRRLGALLPGCAR